MSKIHITVNSRLSQLLKTQLTQFNSQGIGETPKVITLSQWWEQWHSNGLLGGEISLEVFDKRVLSSFEAKMIWESLLNKKLDNALLNPSTTAKQLEQAWHLFQEYTNLEALSINFINAETQLFIQLQADYQNWLNKHNLTDKSLLQKNRLQQLRAGVGGLPKEFILHGFDSLAPFMQQWQDIIIDRGCLVSFAKPSVKASKQSYFVARNLQDEAQQVANWAMQKIAELKTKKPLSDIRIGIVAPNLNEVLFATQWAIEEKLCDLGCQPLSQERGWLNISLGKSLAQVSLVKNALLTLDIFANPDKTVRYDDWSNWLLSPYTQDNFSLRHELDVQLRKLQWSSFKWTSLISSKQIKNFPKAMRNCLTEQAKIKLNTKLNLTEFVEKSFALLENLHWAKSQANGALSSVEFQQKRTFLMHLSSFKTFHIMPDKQSFHSWLSLFKSYISEQVHQAESGVVQPIQLLGMLEAGGQSFDALWVMGLNDEAWPRVPSPNPFLPLEVQRNAHLPMPRCDAERELDYAETLMTRFVHSAKEIVWSYAKQKNAQTLMASPLLNVNLGLLNPQKYDSLAQLSWQAKSSIEWLEDCQAPQVPLGSIAPGGTGVLAAQNVCPLMAFMDYRLGTKYGIETVEDGLQSTSLGSLVHKVLERFWLDIKSHTELLKISDENLTAKVDDLITHEMESLQQRFDDNYLALEKHRILELLLSWFELEKQRNSFEVIENELESLIEVGGIQFKIKIDRIDKVDSELLIIDYKTGKAKLSELYNAKMSAPQLAIYLYGIESLNKKVAGLGYGILHSDDGVKISVILDEAERLCNKKTKGLSFVMFDKLAEKPGFEYSRFQWKDFLTQLKLEVKKLAESVQHGEAVMMFEDEKDIAYAGCLLALRVPEVQSQKLSFKSEL